MDDGSDNCMGKDGMDSYLLLFASGGRVWRSQSDRPDRMGQEYM